MHFINHFARALALRSSFPHKISERHVRIYDPQKEAFLRHMDGVISDLFGSKEDLTVTNLRRYVNYAMKGVQEVCEGLVNRSCKKNMILALFVRS